MAKYFPQIYWSYVSCGTILNMAFTSIMAILSNDWVITLTFFGIYQLFLIILYKVRLEYFLEKSFNSMQKKRNLDTEIHTEFYDDYFIMQGKRETIRINYNDIDYCIETDTNFYLKIGKINKVIIIQKNSCDLELISFIREKFSNLEHCFGDKFNFKSVKKYHNPNFIKEFMIILFVITICSLHAALWTVNLVNKVNPQHGFYFTRNNWAFWCWLPVPLLSIILGFKYKKLDLNVLKTLFVDL